MKQGFAKRRLVSYNQETSHLHTVLYDQSSNLYTIAEGQSPNAIPKIDIDKRHPGKLRLNEAGRMVLKTFELMSGRNGSFRSNGSRYSSMPSSPRRGIEESRAGTPIWARSGTFRRDLANSPTKGRVTRLHTFRDNTAIAILCMYQKLASSNKGL